MLKRLFQLSLLLSGTAGLIAWWRLNHIRRNRMPAPQAQSLIRNPDTEISLRRDGDTLCVEWSAKSSRAEIYLSDASRDTSQKQAVAIVEHQNVALLHGIYEATRYQVEVRLDNGRVLKQIERILPLKSVPNFRDIGGYPTKDGYAIRWNQVYRSSALDNLSVEDSKHLEEIGIQLLCDVRTIEEYQSHPDKVPDSMTVMNFAPASDDNVWIVLARLLFQAGFLENLLLDLYQRVMIEDNPQVIKGIFEQLADADNFPIVIHCAAGKDRTGITIALLLAFLGVADETILADYTLSNHYYDFFKLATRKSLAQLRIMSLTESDFDYLLIADGRIMQDTLNYVRDTYGSIESYLINHADISGGTLQAIRDNLLE